MNGNAAVIIRPEEGGAAAFFAYSYSYNNPLKYTDPDGHAPTDGCEWEGCLTDPRRLDRQLHRILR